MLVACQLHKLCCMGWSGWYMVAGVGMALTLSGHTSTPGIGPDFWGIPALHLLLCCWKQVCPGRSLVANAPTGPCVLYCCTIQSLQAKLEGFDTLSVL